MSINLGLERIHALLSHLPIYTRPTIHLAGTNGKGSVSAVLSSILQASSLSVGRFNSPHLVSVHDCISINGQPIRESLYIDALKEIEHLNQVHQIQASPFEVLTTIALVIFERSDVDIVVLEAGLGGRLDATNVVSDDCIRVAALTAVDLDHQAYLGDTVAAISREKAAIARREKPFVLGAQAHSVVEGVVKEAVDAVGGVLLHATQVENRPWNDGIDGARTPPSNTPLFVPPDPRPVVTRIPCFPDPIPLTLPLHGDHQLLNLGLALSIVSALVTHYPSEKWTNSITPASVSKGVKAVIWPGRLTYDGIVIQNKEIEVPFVILADGAHNAASALTLSKYLSELKSDRSPIVRLHYVLALSHSPPKTPFDTLSPLFTDPISSDTHVACVRFSPPASMPWVKSESPSVIKDVISSLSHLDQTRIWAAPDEVNGGTEQLKQALGWLSKNINNEGTNVVVVAGSLYLVADLYRLLDQIERRLII